MKFIVQTLALVVLIGVGTLWATSLPKSAPEDALVALSPSTESGAVVFAAAGCASCHGAEEDKYVLSGGHELISPFGTFVSPNISSSAAFGIGSWTLAQFDTALRYGTSPEGEHYYPAFPYASYTKMRDQDVVDLFAYMQTLPADDTPSAAHNLRFPFNIRAGIGLWKSLNVQQGFVLADASTPELDRGRYLVEALGHCAECHTPRNLLGGLQLNAWMMGGPNPSGTGTIPAIHPSVQKWAAEDVAYYLETGFTPTFDSVGGSMKSVVSNFSQLPASDRQAVAAYLKVLP